MYIVFATSEKISSECSGDDAVVDLGAVDRATDQIAVSVNHKRQYRRLLRKIEVHAGRCFPDGIATLRAEDVKQ